MNELANQPKPAFPVWIIVILLIGIVVIGFEGANTKQASTTNDQARADAGNERSSSSRSLTADEQAVASIVESSPYAEKELKISFLKQDLQALQNQLAYVYNMPASRGATMNPYMAQREALRRNSSANSIQSRIDWVTSEIARIESEIRDEKMAKQKKFRETFESYERKKYGR